MALLGAQLDNLSCPDWTSDFKSYFKRPSKEWEPGSKTCRSQCSAQYSEAWSLRIWPRLQVRIGFSTSGFFLPAGGSPADLSCLRRMGPWSTDVQGMWRSCDKPNSK